MYTLIFPVSFGRFHCPFDSLHHSPALLISEYVRGIKRSEDARRKSRDAGVSPRDEENTKG